MFKNKILYHAISAYQLYEVIIHRLSKHKHSYAVLILPDFIVYKYPQWKKLVEHNIFNEVYLFPYMHIPHNRETVVNDVMRQYEMCIPHKIERFRKVYVAGAHFYFSIYLIEKKKKFIAFEDAAGMLKTPYRLEDNLRKTFPVHGEMAASYDLFSLDSKFIKQIIVNKKDVSIHAKRISLFNPEEHFMKISAKKEN